MYQDTQKKCQTFTFPFRGRYRWQHGISLPEVVCSQTVEKMVDVFIRDRSLKECPLYRCQYGCWSATSIETSVYDVIDMHLECSWTCLQSSHFVYNVLWYWQTGEWEVLTAVHHCSGDWSVCHVQMINVYSAGWWSCAVGTLLLPH